ncbi:hypothetical protein ACFTWS_39810 [Streptomyces sp. NPDC057027]|uniref:hypothetical protein n=1 Tax=Streptomyces sp. NPDC057027 TaxID=3346004 RepID=UPI003628605D
MSQNKIARECNVDAGTASRYFSGARTLPREFHDGILAMLDSKGVEVPEQDVAELEELRASMLAAGKSPVVEAMRLRERFASAVAGAATQADSSGGAELPQRVTGSEALQLVLGSLLTLVFPALLGVGVSFLRTVAEDHIFFIAAFVLLVCMTLAVLFFAFGASLWGVLHLLEVAPHRRGAVWHAYGTAAVALMAVGWVLAGIAAPEVLGPLHDLGAAMADRDLPDECFTPPTKPHCLPSVRRTDRRPWAGYEHECAPAGSAGAQCVGAGGPGGEPVRLRCRPRRRGRRRCSRNRGR